jgi:hypothetical protein
MWCSMLLHTSTSCFAMCTLYLLPTYYGYLGGGGDTLIPCFYFIVIRYPSNIFFIVYPIAASRNYKLCLSFHRLTFTYNSTSSTCQHTLPGASYTMLFSVPVGIVASTYSYWCLSIWIQACPSWSSYFTSN